MIFVGVMLKERTVKCYMAHDRAIAMAQAEILQRIPKAIVALGF